MNLIVKQYAWVNLIVSYLFFSEGDERAKQQASEFNTTEQSQALLMLKAKEKDDNQNPQNFCTVLLSGW